MDIHRSDINVENMIEVFSSIVLSCVVKNDITNLKSVLLQLYNEGYRDGIISTIVEQRKQEKENIHNE